MSFGCCRVERFGRSAIWVINGGGGVDADYLLAAVIFYSSNRKQVQCKMGITLGNAVSAHPTFFNVKYAIGAVRWSIESQQIYRVFISRTAIT